MQNLNCRFMKYDLEFQNINHKSKTEILYGYQNQQNFYDAKIASVNGYCAAGRVLFSASVHELEVNERRQGF